MKLVIDEKTCIKHKMTIEEFILALAIRSCKRTDETLNNMEKREIIVFDTASNNYLVTQHWSDVIDEILCDSGNSVSDERLLNLAKKIREAFPSGFNRDERTNAIYYHKGNSTAIKLALKRFITHFGDHSDEEILDATKRYVASFRGNYSRIQMANYFVYKDNRTKGGEITSSLATFLENKESEEEEVINSDDWLMNSRN